MRLTASQRRIVRALANGQILKSHRFLDGSKVNRLHNVDGSVLSTVSARDVKLLEKRGLITSNMKFPAAAFLLTQRGVELAATLTKSTGSPLSVRLPHD